jgi:hypothetical protein
MPSRIQSILFDKRYFTVEQAINWLKKYRRIPTKVHETKKYYRFRQFNPDSTKKHRIITLAEGVKAVIEIY